MLKHLALILALSFTPTASFGVVVAGMPDELVEQPCFCPDQFIENEAALPEDDLPGAPVFDMNSVEIGHVERLRRGPQGEVVEMIIRVKETSREMPVTMEHLTIMVGISEAPVEVFYDAVLP